ncbi:ribonuclease H family protein [Halorubrum vacuolatum]|uniref:Ribonuclease n=1 Tax=Halorubrum vacuolatum TaxID=63740 RepID=A0A238WV33_HALVU|nr:ribonuclease HII [Halorubrum vacuolatum]SNR50268.1 RNase HII [Halorubrum vacuolatum]
MYIGVDEAGKGPVLGPMIAAAVRADPADLPDDVDDSKRVAPARREAIDAELRGRSTVRVAVATVEPAAIDSPETDMNTLTVLAQAAAVRSVADPEDRVIADAGDTSENRFARRLRDHVIGEGGAGDTEPSDSATVLQRFVAVESHGRDTPERSAADPDEPIPAPKGTVDVTARHGADADDPVVAAASVVAKVVRDDRMAAIDAAYPAYDGVGSGYPSDPTTRRFLEAYVADHGDVPDCARRSWSTCADVLAANEQAGLGDF